MKKINLLSLSFVSVLSLIALAGCKKEPVKLLSVTDLKVTRVENKWSVSFGASENASSYSLLVTRNADVIKEERELTATSYTMDPIAETGVYVFSVTANGDETNYLASDAVEVEYKVEVYNEKDVNGVKMSGLTEEGKPIGTFHYVYGDGSTYDGTVNDDFSRLNGKHQYLNKMYYEGDFVNDNFEGNGLFTWSMTGDWHDGNTYQGAFVGGGFNDQIGTYYTAANWTRPLDYTGIYNWTGKHGAVFGICGKVGEVGKGEFQFGNNSIYSGDLKVTGDWVYARHGKGWNKWIVNETSPWIAGGSDTKLIDGFEGDFHESGWVKGDGIWYFKDANGNPESYIKGNWDGGNRLGDSTAELTVREEYKNATEIKL